MWLWVSYSDADAVKKTEEVVETASFFEIGVAHFLVERNPSSSSLFEKPDDPSYRYRPVPSLHRRYIDFLSPSLHPSSLPLVKTLFAAVLSGSP